MKKNISIIIPVYNSEKNLNELNKRIISVLSDSGNLYEIIYINDGSIDNSEKVLKNHHNNISTIKENK